MNKFIELYKSDLKRYENRPYTFYEKRFHYLKRRCETTKGLFNLIYKGLFYLHSFNHQMEIKPEVKCGKGLFLCHPYSITINKNATLGNNITLYKGVMIGGQGRGERRGVPTIGNNVWIGMYACIVGKITIGDDVLIAANSFINRDIPSHSIVFGNPCIIKPKENATEGYLKIIE